MTYVPDKCDLIEILARTRPKNGWYVKLHPTIWHGNCHFYCMPCCLFNYLRQQNLFFLGSNPFHVYALYKICKILRETGYLPVKLLGLILTIVNWVGPLTLRYWIVLFLPSNVALSMPVRKKSYFRGEECYYILMKYYDNVLQNGMHWWMMHC